MTRSPRSDSASPFKAVPLPSTSGSIFTATRAPNPDWLARAVPEAAIEAELPIVDPHMHLWDHKSGYKYFVEEFARDVATSGHNVEATVYIECHSMYRASGPEHLKYVGETEFAVGMAAMAASGKYTSCRVAAGIVGFADLTQGERTRETLEAHIEAANGRFRGVRQRGKWDPDPVVRGPVSADRAGVFLDPEFGKGLDLLASMGLAFDASIFHPQLPDVAALARAHPDASIVVIHTGSPVGHSSYTGKEAEVHATWLAGMKELAKCPNVSIKMGGLLMCLGNFDFSIADAPPTSERLAQLWRPYIEPCIELFGAHRCMASSNFPVEKAGVPYGTIWNTFKRLTAGCSADERKMIFSGTARRVYRLV
ncbi:amidohydrolase family protein [Rhodoferax sediminis]|uniref:Amidohydrolase n=1 Tax=Rhodoferax sediminis TaxID=2509614 RepID=A0A515DE46_9BURK|nr:amidohydrolase family protein [Rhodoferax sediminis]QDL38675.1 amidohydrolase [Rhodoferax sediminis]